MSRLLSVVMILCAAGLYAAPVESGFTHAPRASASPEEKDSAYREARSRLITAAQKYEHTPYRYGGADKNGLDCSGLVFVSFRDGLGISVPRTAGTLYAWAETISLDKTEPGDLLFFITDGKSVSHVGIYLGGGRFIHAASEGPVTGVIYSSLDESYWSHTYAGAGRALPGTGAAGGADATIAAGKEDSGKEKKSPAKKQTENNILMGVAAAPTWNTWFANGKVIRGVAGQFRVGAEVKPFGKPMIFGAELRPEWDGALGVFRLPLTLSWGMNDKLRVFAGPALSFGEAALTVSGGSRLYRGGTSWFGAAGITVAPFALTIGQTVTAPYAELAWQSYFSDSAGRNIGADLTACIRVSTGLRCTWRLK